MRHLSHLPLRNWKYIMAEKAERMQGLHDGLGVKCGEIQTFGLVLAITLRNSLQHSAQHFNKTNPVKILAQITKVPSIEVHSLTEWLLVVDSCWGKENYYLKCVATGRFLTLQLVTSHMQSPRQPNRFKKQTKT